MSPCVLHQASCLLLLRLIEREDANEALTMLGVDLFAAREYSKPLGGMISFQVSACYRLRIIGQIMLHSQKKLPMHVTTAAGEDSLIFSASSSSEAAF